MKVKTMKAAILVESNKPLIIDTVELPDELEFGQVLVKIKYSGICGSQLGEIAAVKGPDRYLPHLLGHEASGEVVEVGGGVKTVATGDHVVLHWKTGDGIESAPPVYTWQGKPLNAGFVTTFNEYAIVAENRVTTIGKDFDPRVAPLFGCAVLTGLGVVNNNAKVTIGESVVVFGAGGVGLNVIQGAAMSSAYPIIAVDLLDNKLEMAAKFGATHFINSSKQDVVEEVQKILGTTGADVVIENTGNTGVIAQAYDLTSNKGRLTLVGVPKAGDKTSLYTLPLYFGKSMSGSWGGEAKPEIDIPRFERLYQAGRLNLDDLLTDEFAFDDINDALDAMRAGKVAGRCLLKIQD